MARSGNFNVSYRQDIAIFRTLGQKIWLGILGIILLLYPLLLGEYYIYIINFALIAIIAAVGLNLLTGYTGQISLGHAAFLAVGAYATAIFSSMGLPFIVVLLLSGLAALILGLIIGFPSLRLEGLYLAIATMAFYFIVAYGISHWTGLTGGQYGLKVAPLHVMGIPVDSNTRFYYLLLMFVVAAVYFATNLARSRVGRAFVAIRDRDIAAEVIGIDVARYKLISFAVSSAYAGIAGSLYAYFVGILAPEHFGFDVSIQYIAMIIAGGLGSIEGAIIGALFISLLPEGLRFVTGALASSFPELSNNFLLLKEGVYGLIIILFLIIEPTGLYGIWRRIKDSWETFPYRYR